KCGSWSTLNRSFSSRTHTRWTLFGHVNTVWNGRYGDSEPEMFQVLGFRLTSCDMAARLFQIATLIQTPGEIFLKPLMLDCPRFKHTPRAHYPGNAAAFSQHSEAVVMRQPDTIIVQNISLTEAIQSLGFGTSQASHGRLGG